MSSRPQIKKPHGSISRGPLKPKRSSPFGRLVFVLLLLIAATVLARNWLQQSPKQFWKQLVEYFAKPQPQPVVLPSPAPVAAVTPVPAPAVAPTPAPTPVIPLAPDPLAWLLEHKDRAPKEVTLLAEAEFPAVLDGKVVGTAKVAAGSKVGVAELTPQSIGVVFHGGGKRLPYEATNVLELVKLEMNKPDATPIPQEPVVAATRTTVSPAAQSDLIYVKEFVHPGVVLTKANLHEIEHGVRSGREPWKSWFKQYDGDPGTVGNEGQFEEYGRNADIHRGEFQSDMWQLYRMAMLWTVKKDKRAAGRGIGILENYARNHKRFAGVEASFMQGDCLNGIVAAEILRSTYPGWNEDNTAHIKRYFDEVWWQPLRIGKDNSGAGSHLWTANQGTIGLKVAMALSIFCDDPARFSMCVNSYLTDPLTGLEDSLPNGEVGDTGRDSGHWTAECIDNGWICQLAWAQGLDLFAQRKNRIVAISEFLAQNQLKKLGLCKEIAPFIPFGCSYDFYTQAAPFNDVRGREFFDVIDTYALRKHVPAPFTHELLRHEDFKAIYTLDDAIHAAPIATPWTPPITSPVTDFRSANVGASHGSTAHSGKVWKLHGESAKMEEGYHFAYLEVQGDCVFVARVLDKGGVVMTDSLKSTGGSRCVWFEADSKGSCVHWSHGAHSYLLPWDLKYFGAPKTPFWLKLVRRGLFIAASQSVDGVNWSPAADVLFEWGGLPEKIYVGLSAHDGNASFDFVSLGTAPSSVPGSPKDIRAGIFSTEARLNWKPDHKTVFCDVLRAEQKNGPYTTIANRIITNCYTDTTLGHDTTYYYVISPAGYSGRGPDSQEISVHPL